ncbi:uncharacterized protein SCHCODRAFT_02580019 [Schizophyllum commune H4-8]|nr:uncharacterized protein SCHCODRAFT_02580019 [Schizophyllum commune H4-8]KAI5890941.1 hypothetical protein SCHCODRAFT_02580019 [Schizophyllum commune H4-8]
MNPLLRNSLIGITRPVLHVNLAPVASSSRRALHVTYLRCKSIDENNRERVDGPPDGKIATSLSSPPNTRPSAGGNSRDTPSATISTDTDSKKSPPRPRPARSAPLRKRTICLSNVLDGTSISKLKEFLSDEFGHATWVTLGPYAPGKRASNSSDRPRRRHAYVLFAHASSVDKVRARLGSLIDFDGTALFPELIPPVAVGGPTNKALHERLYPRKDPLHPAGVRPKDTLFVRRLENVDSQELRKHIEASCRDLVSLTRLGSCFELQFIDVRAASRARTKLKDYFRRSDSTAWVDFKTDEGDLPVVLRAQVRDRAEQLRRLQRALSDPARDDKEDVQAAMEVARQKLEEAKEKLARMEEPAAKSE